MTVSSWRLREEGSVPTLLRLAASTVAHEPPPIIKSLSAIPKDPPSHDCSSASSCDACKLLPSPLRPLPPLHLQPSSSHAPTLSHAPFPHAEPSNTPSERKDSKKDRNERLVLPVPVSQAIFEALREAAEERRAEGLGGDALNLFTHATTLPLHSMDLSGCAALSTKRLESLLIQQRLTLRSLDVSSCEGLHPKIVPYLARHLSPDRAPLLPHLKTLILGNSVQCLGGQQQEEAVAGSLFNGVGDLLDHAMDTELAELASDVEMTNAPPLFPYKDLSEVSAPSPGASEMDDAAMDSTDEAKEASTSSSHDPKFAVQDSGVDFSDSDMHALQEGSPDACVWVAEEGYITPPRPRQLSATESLVTTFTDFCPNVEVFSVHGFSLEEAEFLEGKIPFLLSRVLAPLRRLRYLDLSWWEGMEDGRCLAPLAPTLTSLVLFNVPDLWQALQTICSLNLLTHLDISQGSQETGRWDNPCTSLESLVLALPHLRALDISSTNLASGPSEGDRPLTAQNEGGVKSDIAGLRALRQKLEFLGLVNCDRACLYKDIPAIKVAGDNEREESQVVTALEAYQQRLQLLQPCLNDSYQLYRYADVGRLKQHTHAMLLVLSAMNSYPDENNIQIAGSAALFYIIRRADLTPPRKKEMIRVLLNGMEAQMDEQVMVRNCCLTLCQLDIPHDVLHDYRRTAHLLITAMETHTGDDMTQRIVVYLLNSMACHVDGDQKVAVGQLNAIEFQSMLGQIKKKRGEGVCDEVMEVAWSFLWNITDETPSNCEKFLDNRGMDLFYSCYTSFPGEKKLCRNMMGLLGFPDKKELVRNMMGLMGNIAEVKELRPKLMTTHFIQIFCDLLQSTDDGIEISYNSAGVLAHIASDGPEGWMVDSPTLGEMCEALVSRTESWSLTQKRFINYRSFGPILGLLGDGRGARGEGQAAAMHWAVWALANLTTVDGKKYCGFVVDEGGVERLQSLETAPSSSPRLKELVRIVLSNVEKWPKLPPSFQEERRAGQRGGQ